MLVWFGLTVSHVDDGDHRDAKPAENDMPIVRLDRPLRLA